MNLFLQRSIRPMISIVFLMVGSAFFTTFLSLYVEEQTKSPSLVGVIQAIFFAGYIFGARHAASVIGKSSHTKTYFLLTGLYLFMVSAIGAIHSPIAWALLRFASGYCLSILYIVIESWILILSPGDSRGSAVGVYMVGLYLSQTLGQLIIHFIEISSRIPFIIALSLIALSILPLIGQSIRKGGEAKIEKRSLLSFYRARPLGVLICALGGAAVGILFTYGPLNAIHFDLSVALFMGLTIFGGLSFQYPVGLLSDRISRLTLLRYFNIAMAILALLIAFPFYPTSLHYLLAFLFGGFLFSVYPISISYVAESFESSSYTSLCGQLLSVNSLGSIVGPLFAAISISRFTPQSLYVVMGLFAILATAISLKPIKENTLEYV